MTTAFNPLDVHLPKWPQMRVWGTSVTVEQAKDIIFRTDPFFTTISSYSGGNNHAWHKWANEVMGRKDLVAREGKYPFNTVWRITDLVAQKLGHLSMEYVSNDWASCCFIGGPHGWCHPNGTISFEDNVGKWPSTRELLEEWANIAKAFPYLDLTATFMSGESCEYEETHPVFSISVKDGVATALAAILRPEVQHVPPVERFIQRDGFDASYEQGLPNEWIQELGVRYSAAVTEAATVVLAELETEPS